MKRLENKKKKLWSNKRRVGESSAGSLRDDSSRLVLHVFVYDMKDAKRVSSIGFEYKNGH